MVMMQTLIGSYATVSVAQAADYYFTLRGSGGGGGGEDTSTDANARTWTSGGPGGGGAQVEIRIDDVPSGMQFVMAVPSGGGAGGVDGAGGGGGGGGGATVLAAIHNGVEQLIAIAAGGGAGGGGGDGSTTSATTRAGSGGAGLAGSNSKSASVNDGDGHTHSNRNAPTPGGGATGTANGANSKYSTLNPVTTTTYGNKGGSGGEKNTSTVQATQTNTNLPSHVISDSYAVQGGFGGEASGGEGGGGAGGGGYFAGAGGSAPNGGNDGGAGGGGGSSYIAGGIWSGSSTLTFGSATITINVVGNNTSGARGVLINTGEANPNFRLSAAQTTSVQWTGSIADLSEKGRGGSGSEATSSSEDPQSGAAGVIIYGTDLASPTVVEPSTHDRVANGVPNTDLPAVQTTVTT